MACDILLRKVGQTILIAFNILVNSKTETACYNYSCNYFWPRDTYRISLEATQDNERLIKILWYYQSDNLQVSSSKVHLFLKPDKYSSKLATTCNLYCLKV